VIPAGVTVPNFPAIDPYLGPPTGAQQSALQALIALGTQSVEQIEDELPRLTAAATITVLIPAHNEAASIGQTLRSLGEQSRCPDGVVVVADNCTDDTAAVAAVGGARVITTVGNTGRKAGALNQALSRVLPQLRGDDLVLIMDADSQIGRDWIKSAADRMVSSRRIGGLCGVFTGEGGKGMLGQLQRNEYARAARTISRRSKIWVLSGCGTLLRVSALREVARQRGQSLPGVRGHYFDTSSITEDFELTLALMTLGFQCVAAPACVAVTEVMPHWRDLWRQRLRWQKGTIRDLRHYGITRVTWGHWLRQVFAYASYAVMGACWAVMGVSLTSHQHINLRWGAGVLAISLTERLWTARKAGWPGVGLALLVVVEFGYGLFLQVMMLWALLAEFLKLDDTWHHVTDGNR
jgi:cellulose synthase/poly-beta-1,6-N-acetylglucosamine synthase-like glycosyltransferase